MFPLPSTPESLPLQALFPLSSPSGILPLPHTLLGQLPPSSTSSPSMPMDTNMNTSASWTSTPPSQLPDDIEVDVGNGWMKRIVRRKGGKSEGSLDVYISPPHSLGNFTFKKGKRLRSNEELIKFLADNPAAIATIDPTRANFHKSFEICSSFSQRRLEYAITHIQANVGPDGTADMSGFNPPKEIAARNKSTLAKRKMVNSSKSDRKSSGLQIDAKREAYLQRQHARVAFPNAQNLDFLAYTMGVSVADVASWFRRRNGIDSVPMPTIGEDEAGQEDDEDDCKLTRPPRRFDVLDVPGICDLFMEEDEDDCIDQPPFELEWDNAELDLEANYYLGDNHDDDVIEIMDEEIDLGETGPDQQDAGQL